MFDWNDLRHFLAVARYGSTIRAAKVLGINQSTVQRRVVAFERQLGQPLFQRGPEGYRLTPLSEELRPIAERVELDVADFARHVASSETELVGTIRLTCPASQSVAAESKAGGPQSPPSSGATEPGTVSGAH